MKNKPMIRMSWKSTNYTVDRVAKTFKFNSPWMYVILGTALGLSLLQVSSEMVSWSMYKWIYVSFLGLVCLFTLITGGNIRRVLFVTLILTIPLNFSYLPLSGHYEYHPGGAQPTVVLFPYDFPLIGLIILGFYNSIVNNNSLFNTKDMFCLKLDFAAMLLIIWSAMSIHNSSYIHLSLFEILRMIKLYLLTRIIASNVKKKEDLTNVLIALLIGLTLQSVLGLLQYVSRGSLGLYWSPVGELYRVVGTFGAPNTLGAYTATIMVIMLSLWISRASGRLIILIVPVCMLSFFTLVLTFSRGAWLAFMVGVAFSLFIHLRRSWFNIRRIVWLINLVLYAVIVGAIFFNPIVTRLHQQTFDARTMLNQIAVRMIEHHPVLGVGINTFVNVMGKYDTTGVSYYFPEPVHNIFLLVAAETGFVGIGLFLLLILITFREGLQASKTDDRFLSAFAIGILGGLVVLLVSNLPDVHLRTEVLYAHFWLFIGLIIAMRGMTTSENH